MYILWIVVALVIILAGWIAATYNSLVAKRKQVEEAWSDIDVQLKLRYDLVPRLVNTVKGFAAQEKSVFLEVTEARSKAMKSEQDGDVKQASQAEAMLQKALINVLALAEAYPELKSNENFLDLQRQLTVIEDKLSAARRFYNGIVRAINTQIDQFPSNIIAGMFKFEEQNFFEADEVEREAPAVDFAS